MFCSGGMVYYIYRNIDYAPFTGRIRFIGGVTRESELSLGRQAFEDLVNNFQGRVLPARHPVTQRVRKVVRRLARTVRSMDSGLCEDFEWMVAVADVPEPNAMCAPGGRILVTTGLLEILDNDDELAVILGHEITHALNRHGVETLSLRRIMWPLIFLINQIFDLRFLPSVFATMFLTLPYSRKLEYEADEVGLMICVEACYNPKVGPGVFRRLDQVQKDVGGSSGTKIGSWFSTHPHSLDRAKTLEKDMPKRVSRFEQHCPSSATGLKGFAENFGRDWA